MAKTAQQWYDIIVAEKQATPTLSALQPNVDNAQQLLTDVSSPSQVARWRLWVWVVAASFSIFEGLMESYLIQTEAAANRQYGTRPWYVQIAKQFQFGDPLVWLGNGYGYAVLDTTKHVVKQAAVIEANNQVIVKVADVVGGVITPLSSLQLAAFSQYIKDLRPAGINTGAKSEPADSLKVELKVYYNPLLISATGESLSSPGVFPVRDAIVQYLQALDFGGILKLSSLVDAVQSVQTTEDAILISAEAKYGLLPYTAIVETYLSDAGYMTFDEVNSVITYIPTGV